MNNDFLSELSADFCQFSRELPLPSRYVCESARTQRPLCFSQKNEGCFLFLLRFICKIDVTDEYKMKQNVYSAMIKYFPPSLIIILFAYLSHMHVSDHQTNLNLSQI